VLPVRFERTGRLGDGRQFLAFVTGEFSRDRQKRWVAVTHLFDAAGNLLVSESRVGGHDELDVARARAEDLLEEMTAPFLAAGLTPADAYIRPFSVDLNGVRHGWCTTRSTRPPSSTPGTCGSTFPGTRAGTTRSRRQRPTA
jgi:hypothetical protein